MTLASLLELLAEAELPHVLVGTTVDDHEASVLVWTADEIWQVFYDDPEGEAAEILVYGAGRSVADLERLRDRLSHAWREAGEDLGIVVRAPHALDAGARRIHVSAWIPHVGAARGTAVPRRNGSLEDDEILDAAGYFVPGLNPFHYERYVRATFEAALVDWGWYGPPALRPPWLPWGEGASRG